MRVENISYFTQVSNINNKKTSYSSKPVFGAKSLKGAREAFDAIRLNDLPRQYAALFRQLRDIIANRGMRNLYDWELDCIEGLQNGLSTLENLKMFEVQRLVDLVSKNSISIPVVRGCKHVCAHCYLGATPPIQRMSFEDFNGIVSDISEMATRLHRKVNEVDNYTNLTYLFHDSDCSQVFVYDKEGNIHEFPELARIAYQKLKKPAMFDTAGWDVTDIETQQRMERFVEYCMNDPREIAKINISISPFEKLHYGAVMRKRRGDIEGYNYLRDKYIDMVVNTLQTFSPLFKYNDVGYISRAYPDKFVDPKFDGFRVKDMQKLRYDILNRLERRDIPDGVNFRGYENLYQRFNISGLLGASNRNNDFKDVNTWNLKRDKIASVFIDTDGQVYEDEEWFMRKIQDLKLNLQNPFTKEHKVDIVR